MTGFFLRSFSEKLMPGESAGWKSWQFDNLDFFEGDCLS